MMHEFTFEGKTYKEGKPNYFYCDGERISAAEFREAKRAKYKNFGSRIKTVVEMEGEDTMNVIDVDGVEYRNDWTNGKYYRDGQEISRAEFNKALGINRTEGGKKTTKKRSKDIAFEHDGITITARQMDFLRAMAAEASQGSPEAGWWSDILIESTGISAMSAGAMISTLREKHVITVEQGSRESNGRTRKVKNIGLTDTGLEIFNAIK